MTHQQLTANDPLTCFIKEVGINTWESLLSFTQNLPYGRNSNRTDFGLVIKEQKGSCSSKHAFLKKVADLNNIPNVKLILGMYQMNHTNTPNIGNVLSINSIDFIPEAHCYLKINDKRTDITSLNANIENLEKYILKEIEITPEQVVHFKVKYHQEFLQNWIIENNIKHSFKSLWAIREECIANLSNNK